MGIWTTIVVLATVVAGGLTVGRWMLTPPNTHRPATVSRRGRSRPRHAR